MNYKISSVLTDKFSIKISETDKLFVSKQVTQYTYAFNKVYKNKDLIADETFRKQIQSKYGMSLTAYNFLTKDVEQQSEFFLNNQSQVKDEIKQLKTKLIIDFKKRRDLNIINYIKLSNNNKRTLYKRITSKEKQANSDVCWGSKKLLRELQVLTDKLKNLKKTDSLYNEIKAKRYIKLLEWRKARKHNLYYKGTTAAKGNRFFDLSRLNEGIIIYKPENYKERILITFSIHGKKQKERYNKIQSLINLKQIPITIRLNENEICISYDTTLIHGTKFDKNLLKIKQKNTVGIKEKKAIFKQYVSEYESDLISNKLSVRYAAVDLNPSGVGLAIIDKLGDTYKVIVAENYDLSGIIKKNVSPNKRNFEISNLYTKIFNFCDHYKVATFCIEDLNFKKNITEEKSTEFNRLTKNVWNLNLQTRLIRKHCIERGIIYCEVNAAYSSIIGNLRYDYPDPICAALEICKRGCEKYDKGKATIVRFQSELVEDALKKRKKMDFDLSSTSNWNELFKITDRSIRVNISNYLNVKYNPLTSKRTNIIRNSMTKKKSLLLCNF